MPEPQTLTVVKSEPLPSLTVAKSEPDQPHESTLMFLSRLAAGVTTDSEKLQTLEGLLKSGVATVHGAGNLLRQIPGIGKALSVADVQVPESAWTPTNTPQAAGKLAGDVGQFFIPGPGGKGKVAAAVIDAAKSGVLGASQAGGDVSAGVIPAVVSAVSHGSAPLLASISDRLKSGAVKSMIRALGPTGGRGPTGDQGLEKAEEIAPDLVRKSFMPLTQDAARAQATKGVDVASSYLKDALATEGGQTFNQPKLLQSVQEARAALRVAPKPGADAILPQEHRAADAIFADIEADVKAMGPDPTNEAMHTLKQRWNDVADYAKRDPAAGSKADLYRRGGDLVRAQLATDATTISKADQEFHKAATLNELLNATSTRRPDTGVVALLSPYAARGTGALIGGAEGYRQGGVAGGVVGALTGYQVGRVLQSPGFRYVSAAVKTQLAKALDSGDEKLIRPLLTAAAAQIQAREKQP